MDLYSFCRLFLIFFSFSCIGYIVETIHVSLNEHKLNLNRGFCVGPYIPIYGIGSILIIMFVVPYIENPFEIFLVSMLVCAIVEYLVSYTMEALFKSRLWDYSNRKYNIHGRVCLENTVYFGVGGLAVTYVLYPMINKLLDIYSEKSLIIISIVCMSILVIDVGLSIVVACKYVNKIKKIKDSTIFIHKKRINMMETWFEKTFIGRLYKGFPSLGKDFHKTWFDKLKDFTKIKK